MGLGLNINIGGGQDYNIITPLHDPKNEKMSYSESQAIGIGFSKIENQCQIVRKVEDKHEQKTHSREGTLGVGWQKVTRYGVFSKSVGLSNTFKETGLYDLLGVPVQIHF